MGSMPIGLRGYAARREGRDKMHRAAKENPEPTDSMKMFLMEGDGDKPAPGTVGAQPEWFYKGGGSQTPERRAVRHHPVPL